MHYELKKKMKGRKKTLTNNNSRIIDSELHEITYFVKGLLARRI